MKNGTALKAIGITNMTNVGFLADKIINQQTSTGPE
jgi:hypothetical protein